MVRRGAQARQPRGGQHRRVGRLGHRFGLSCLLARCISLGLRLRRLLAGSAAMFVAVTGHASAQDQQAALAAGFDSFLVKPLDADSLARLLHAYADRPA